MMSGKSLFQIVDKSLKKKLEFYKLLDEDGAIGTKTDVMDHQGNKFDFYHHNGKKKIPTSPTKEFLQGGLVSSFAVFEWFLQEILFEFGRAINHSVDTDELREKIKLTSPRLWCFNAAFQKVASGADKDLKLLKSSDGQTDRTFRFYYPLTNEKYSIIRLQNVEELDCILNLWYAMRIIVAHGNVSQSFKDEKGGAFNKFISALESSASRGNTGLQKIHEGLCFAHFLDHSNISVQATPKLDLNPAHLESMQLSAYGKTTATAGAAEPPLKYENIPAIPVSVEDLEKSTSSEKLTVLESSFKKLFGSNTPDIKDICLSENHGFYHIGRVAYIMYMLISGSYISYRMLIRINQFLRVLSFHIDLALRKWLKDNGCTPARNDSLIKEWDYANEQEVEDAISTMLEECRKDLENLKVQWRWQLCDVIRKLFISFRGK